MTITRIIFIFFLLTGSVAYAFEKKDVIDKVKRLENVNDQDLKDSVEIIINNLFQFEKPFGKEVVDKMIKSIKGRNKNATLLCLSSYPEFVSENKIKYIDEAYRFAMANGLDNYREGYYLSKSHIFREEQVYDSSMIYILKARNIAQNSNPEFFVTTLHQLGDIYFSVGLYDYAEKYYKMVDSIKGSPFSWINWRRAVIRNNMGLIEIERKNYDKALALFNQSLNQITIPVTSYADSLRLCYDQRMIASILLKKGDYNGAWKAIQFPFEFAYKHQLKDHLFGIYKTLILLSIKTGDNVSVEKYYKLLDQFYEKNQASMNIKPDYTLLCANVHEFLGDKSKATDCYKEYIQLNDSLAIQEKTAAIVQLLTEQDYNHLEENLKQVKTEQMHLLLIIALLLALISIIIVRSQKTSKLNKLLAETNKTKDKFFSIISHDLKSPFNSLLGFTEILLENLDGKDYKNAKESGEIIHQKSEELYGLITNLLDWSRSQHEGFKLVMNKIDISKIISEVIRLYSAQAGSKKITVDSELSGEILVMADRTCLTTIFSNLLSNAIKFTPESGHIHFKPVVLKTLIEIHVSDTGVGISTEQIEKLFDLSKNISTEGTNHEKGTGLGLLVTKEFVEKNGGSISVKSKKGEGSTFIVRLKLA